MARSLQREITTNYTENRVVVVKLRMGKDLTTKRQHKGIFWVMDLFYNPIVGVVTRICICVKTH